MPDTDILAHARSHRRIDGNESVSLWDAGDGVALLEIHSPRGDLGVAAVDLLERVPTLVRADHAALVIANDHERGLCRGGSLTEFIALMESDNWDGFSSYLRRGQDALLALRYAPFPVIAAAYGVTLAGGSELMLHCDAVVAHGSLVCGFVEEWSGIIPGWGGCTQMLRRWQISEGDPGDSVAQVFQLMSAAEIKTTANAREARLLLAHDELVEDRARLVGAAKDRARTLAEGYAPPPAARLVAAGEAATALIGEGIEAKLAAGELIESDAVQRRALLHILSCGGAEAGSTFSERQVMDLEHDVFVDLAKRPIVRTYMRELVSTPRRPKRASA
jgi:3-hydroxyacyl-CoA dehydrogenase